MEYSLDHLEITDETSKINSTQFKNTSEFQVLDDLYQQIQTLQDQNKMNLRRLMTFETENNKILQEKNKLFFEAKTYLEKNKLLIEKLQKLEQTFTQTENDLLFKNQKIDALEKVNSTQLTDLKRLTKFYQKIQNIIKPHVQELKNKVQELQSQVTQDKNAIEVLTQLNNESTITIQQLRQEQSQKELKFQQEKNNFIQSYEEQIHFLSKEMVQLQDEKQTLQSEIFRLKKLTENKHFIENELIRFKRDNSEQIQIISDLKLKINQLEMEKTANAEESARLKGKASHQESHIFQLTENLEITRVQLSAKLEEIEQLNLRVKMLEKLNTQLSHSFKNQNS